MKKTIYFENAECIGVRLDSIEDIIKVSSLDNMFGICNEWEEYFDEYVSEVDAEGSETERRPTKEEVLNRTLEAFKNGEVLYATAQLDCGQVVPSASTTLQSRFSVGQEVFILQNNKIALKYIYRIILSDVAHCSSCANKTQIGGISLPLKKTNIYILADKKYYKAAGKCGLISYENMIAVKEDEVFADKQSLVKHLMEE